MNELAYKLHEAIDANHKVAICFEKRTITLDGKNIKLPEVTSTEPKFNFHQCASVLEKLYNRYNHSLGTSDTQPSPYYKALAYDDLSPADRLCGDNRDHCRLQLEYQTLLFILSGELTWPKHFGDKFFWRSPNEPDFVIMRQWIDPTFKPRNLAARSYNS